MDPALVDQGERVLQATPGVLGVAVRLRWIGHNLCAEGEVRAIEAHRVAVDAEHSLLHELPRLTAALVDADPQARGGVDHHAKLASHR